MRHEARLSSPFERAVVESAVEARALRDAQLEDARQRIAPFEAAARAARDRLNEVLRGVLRSHEIETEGARGVEFAAGSPAIVYVEEAE